MPLVLSLFCGCGHSVTRLAEPLLQRRTSDQVRAAAVCTVCGRRGAEAAITHWMTDADLELRRRRGEKI